MVLGLQEKMSYKNILIVIYKIGLHLIKKINPNHNTFIDLYNWGLNGVAKNKQDYSIKKVVEDFYLSSIFKKIYKMG